MVDKPALLRCAMDQFQTARWITFRPAGTTVEGEAAGVLFVAAVNACVHRMGRTTLGNEQQHHRTRDDEMRAERTSSCRS